MKKLPFIMLCFFLTSSCCFSCRHSIKNKQVISFASKKVNSITLDTAKIVAITEPDLKKLVDELNNYLSENDSISPFGNYDPRNFELTKAEVDSLLKQRNQEEKGKVSGSLLNTYVRNHADSLLNKLLSHKAITKYDIRKILNMRVTASPDGKLFSLSYPANTGGTYKNNISVLHYRPGDGSLINNSPDKLNPDGFDIIDTISTEKGVKYLLFGNVVGCATCMEEYVQLLHFKKNKPIVDFSYSISIGMGYDNGAINYDSQRKIIIVEHDELHNNDWETDCDCNTDEAREMLMSSNLENRDSVNLSGKLKTGRKLKCVFYFNGSTFVLDRKRSRMPK